MIEKLESNQIRDQYGDVYGDNPPSSWKPSEKQMEALESARLMYARGLERRDMAIVLESLYHDLEKLM